MNNSEQGVALFEILVSVALVSIVGIGIAMELILSMKIQKFTETVYAANNLAVSKVELLASVNAVDLNSSDNQTENAVSVSYLNTTFTRTTSIVVNADDSRTISINVISNNAAIPGSASHEVTFAVWE